LIVTLLLSRVVVELLRRSSRSYMGRKEGKEEKGRESLVVSGACGREREMMMGRFVEGNRRGTYEDRRKEHRGTGLEEDRKEVRSHLGKKEEEKRRGRRGK